MNNDLLHLLLEGLIWIFFLALFILIVKDVERFFALLVVLLIISLLLAIPLAIIIGLVGLIVK